MTSEITTGEDPFPKPSGPYIRYAEGMLKGSLAAGMIAKQPVGRNETEGVLIYIHHGLRFMLYLYYGLHMAHPSQHER